MPRRSKGPRLRWLAKRAGYYIEWTENGRTRQRSCGTDNRSEAEGQLQSFLYERARTGRTGPREPEDYGVNEAVAAYLEEHAPHTADPARLAYDGEALAPFWEGRTVADISPETCRAYWKWRERAAGTIRHELGTLRAALNHAHREGRLTRVPKVILPSRAPNRDRWLTREEATRLLKSARKDARARLWLPLFVRLALYTGARKGAILGLRWPQVDLEREIINFNIPGAAQTKKRRAVVPIPRQLVRPLKWARKFGTELGFVIHRDGKKIANIKHSFATAAKNAGLKNVTPHTLRHTCATWMAQDGVDLFQIAGWLGHSYARTVELYAHHSPSHLSAAKQAMERRARKVQK
jgi:integrase